MTTDANYSLPKSGTLTQMLIDVCCPYVNKEVKIVISSCRATDISITDVVVLLHFIIKMLYTACKQYLKI